MSDDFKLSKLVLNEAEAARALGLSPRTLQRWRLEGRGPDFVLIGNKRVGYLHEDIHEWLQGRRVSSTADATQRRRPK